MMELQEYLHTHREACPSWLESININNPVFNREEFFKSRVVFYPGACVDGHAIKLFGSSHAAHCFVYCDYLFNQQRIQAYWMGTERGITAQFSAITP